MNFQLKQFFINQVTRILSPQVQENPIYFHMTDSTSEAFRATVDQGPIKFTNLQLFLLSLNSDCCFSKIQSVEIWEYLQNIICH